MAPGWARGALRVAQRELAYRLGIGEVEPTEDRRWLEGRWLAHLASRDDVRSILFVGVRWYTHHYPRLVGGKRFVTLDVDPRAARFGNGVDHVVGDARDVALLLGAASIDSVVFNGVFGWGLDDAPGLARAIDGLADVLRPRGELLFGWNDVPRRRPFDPFDAQMLPVWRTRFEPLASPPLGDAPRLALPTDNRHCFSLFAKRV